MQDQKKDSELSGSLKLRFSTEKKSFSDLLREIQKSEADPLRFARLSCLNAFSVEASLRGHARPKSVSSVAEHAATFFDARCKAPGVNRSFTYVSGVGWVSREETPCQGGSVASAAPKSTITTSASTGQMSPPPKRPEDYEREGALTVCPGCGGPLIGGQYYYCCGTCFHVVQKNIPPGTSFSVGRAYVFRYFQTVRSMVGKPAKTTIKYPNECPCGILSSMCDYHKGL